MDNQYNLTIQSLVYEGYGLSHMPDGKAIFIPYVMPGEQVTVRIRGDKKRYALADLLNVETPHAKRINPRCKHFGKCGGCHYQHISYDLQLTYKKDIFVEQLQRIAHFEAPRVEKVIPSALEWNYRNIVQFQVSPQGKLCFADAQTNALFEVKECHLPMPAINQLWPKLEFESGSFSGRLEIRQNQDEELLLVLEGERESLPELESEASVSIVSTSDDGAVVMAGDDHLNMQVGERLFHVSAGSFFQTNFAGAEALVEEIRKIILARGCRKLLDVYCGVGLFSAFLAGDMHELVAIESSPSACKDFAINLDPFNNVSLYQGTAEQVLPDLDFQPDAVLADPPRTGMRTEALQALIGLHSKSIVYVSCNPATLARDARYIIQAGYTLERSILVDMFPQTYHMESVNLFVLP